MNGEKLIIIGSDDPEGLSALMHDLKHLTFIPHNVISAERISDLIGIARSLNPDLVILCFRNNQLVLNDFESFVRKPETPILCIKRKFGAEALGWNKNSIVFTYPFEQINNKDYLASSINSIFLLKNGLPNSDGATAFVSASNERHQTNNAANLSRHVLELDQKVEFLLKIKSRITDLYPRVDDPVRMELISIVNAIKLSANDTKLWDDFKLYFEQTNPNFLLHLSKTYPVLTPVDLKYCCYLKLNMTNDDIRNLLGINQESVRTHKYRLKKKMSLPRGQDLRHYLRSVG